ncbi:MAG TPA: VOC family protein [Pyrinomonadaceae bacterium]|nr:VOC family protein [Pyrinomonadaceae bacterium]
MNIPTGHQSVMPYLMMEDAAGFIEFIKSVFNAEMTHQDMRGEIIGHCEANINGSTIMFSQSRDEWKPATANLFVYVDDADAAYKKALDAGGKSITEMADQDYGRSGGVEDPSGNVWWITSVS